MFDRQGVYIEEVNLHLRALGCCGFFRLLAGLLPVPQRSLDHDLPCVRRDPDPQDGAAEITQQLFVQFGINFVQAVEPSQQQMPGRERPQVRAIVMQIPIVLGHQFAAGKLQNCGLGDVIVVSRRALRMSANQFLGIEGKQDVVVIQEVKRGIEAGRKAIHRGKIGVPPRRKIKLFCGSVCEVAGRRHRLANRGETEGDKRTAQERTCPREPTRRPAARVENRNHGTMESDRLKLRPALLLG